MAFGSGTLSLIGGAVDDLFSADASRMKARGLKFEQQNYNLAATLADQNAAFTKQSTAIKQTQLDRSIYQAVGGVQAETAGAGFSGGGSSLDILRDSASQGALTKAVAGEQGLITEEGYKVQGQSFRNMASAAQIAIDAANNAADSAPMRAFFKGTAAVASIFT